MHVMVKVQPQSNLLEIVLALGPSGSFTSCLYGRQQQRHQNANDGNDNEQLYERESTVGNSRGFDVRSMS